MSRSLLGEARSRYATGDYQAGLDLTEQAIALLLQDETPSDEDLALALNIKGECQRYLGQLPEAIASYDAAWKHARRTKELAIQSMIASNRGIGYLSQGRIEEGIASQKIALELDLKKGDPEDIAYSRHNLGAALSEAKQTDEALSELAQAIAIRKEIGDWDQLLSSLSLQADILVALHRPEEAKAAIIEALELEELISNKTAMRHPLLVLADIHTAEGDHKAALGPLFAATALVEQMRARASNRAAFDLRYHEYYARCIEALFRTDNFEEAMQLIDQTRARVFSDHEQARLAGGEALAGMALRAEITKSLQPDEALIEMWLYRGSLKTLVTEPSGFGLYQLPDVVAIDTQQALSDLLSEGELRTDSGRAFNDSFLGAIAARAATLRRVYLVPHGIQFQFPVSCLRGGDGRYLCQDIEVAIIPSARSYLYLRARGHHPSRRSLVVGDPDGTLPFALEEARMVSTALNCPALLGREATTERVLGTLRGEVFDVVHFACHYVSAEGPEMSGLLMADGATITAQQIAQSALQANLVCTASCSSGLVPYSPTNDLVGFNGALLLGGTNSIISSIAPLHDRAALSFFKEFYRRYRDEDESGASAFSASQRDMIQSGEFSAPKYWAPLYLTGVS
ncbi:CHAT domain-containing protein [Rhizobium sp. BK251]|uniref:CHAT domain-containing protein n=1 Tax=Rhizobium sp. BK251 TaxID=2512125 RepID=UPI0010D85FDA|nr:CHAT domain-containing protein [Rhizobium sp. BK251]TCL76039.1 tetratricopeptide repeat protein [Rhizobium sp. BK251]